MASSSSAAISSSALSIIDYYDCDQSEVGLELEGGSTCDYGIGHCHTEAAELIQQMTPQNRENLHRIAEEAETCAKLLRQQIDKIAGKDGSLSQLDKWKIGVLKAHIELDDNIRRAALGLWDATIGASTDSAEGKGCMKECRSQLAGSVDNVLEKGLGMLRAFRTDPKAMSKANESLEEARGALDAKLKAFTLAAGI